MIPYFYQAFGCIIKSAIPIPEFLTYHSPENTFDVEISIGRVESLYLRDEVVIQKATYQKSSEELLLDIPNIAKYRIAQGKTIIIEPAKEADESSIRLFLLGTSFGILLQQRALFSIHASGVVKDGKVVLFTGQSGAGKSTICKYFLQKGFSFIGDDYMPISFKNGQAFACPSYPQLKLWDDTLALLSINTKEIHHRLRPEIDKFSVLDFRAFQREPLPIVHCFLIEWSKDNATFEISTPDFGKKVALYRYNTYRFEAVHFKAEEKVFFQHCLKLAQTVPLTAITRGRKAGDFERVFQLVNETVY